MVIPNKGTTSSSGQSSANAMLNTTPNNASMFNWKTIGLLLAGLGIGYFFFRRK